MSPRRLAIFCLVCFLITVVCLVVAIQAEASPATRDAFEAKAVRFWTGQGRELPPLELSHSFDAASDVAAWAVVGRPGIDINIAVWRYMSWEERCHVWLHERGHNAGLLHSSTGVMQPVVPTPVTKTCRGWTP